jgi:hypothetical protein
MYSIVELLQKYFPGMIAFRNSPIKTFSDYLSGSASKMFTGGLGMPGQPPVLRTIRFASSEDSHNFTAGCDGVAV